MDISFAQQDLESLDRLDADTLLLFLKEDDGPLIDLAGIVDWRLAGALSRYLAKGWFTGHEGEIVLFPTHGRLPMLKLIGIGIGKPENIDPMAVERFAVMAGRILTDASVRSVACNLPGDPVISSMIQQYFRLFRLGLSSNYDGKAVLLGDAKSLRDVMGEL